MLNQQTLRNLQQLVRKEIDEVPSTAITRDSHLIQTIQQISNACEQSPTFLYTILNTSQTLLPFLFQIIQSAQHIPPDIQSITEVINFMHHVSLIEGPVRNTMLKRPMVSFITKILTMDKFSEALTRNVKVIGGQIIGCLGRFLTNIKIVGQYILNGFISAVTLLNEVYKQCSLLNFVQKVDPSVEGFEDIRVEIDEKIITRILRCDSKLINLLKIVERTGAMIFQKFTSRSLYMFLRPLLEIALERDNVFLNGSPEHNILRNAIDSIMRAIKNFNSKMGKKVNLGLERNLGSIQIRNALERINQNSAQEEEEQNSRSENQVLNERLMTQNSEQASENQQNSQQAQGPIVIIEQENNNDQNQPQQQEQNPEQAQNSEDQGRMLFDEQLSLSSSESEERQDFVELQEVFEQNKNDKIEEEKSQNKEGMDQEKKTDSTVDMKEFFRQLTWKATKELVQKYQTLPEQVIIRLYECYENLDRLILPIMENTQTKTEELRIKITRQISENFIMEEIDKQNAQSSKSQTKLTTYSFNLVNLSITVYSSKLERILKLMYSTINFENPEFNFPEYETLIQKFSNYLMFYLEMVSQAPARNISNLINNEQLKFLEASKLPKSRIENTTIDVENFKKLLQIELNEKSTLFNHLFDSFIKLVSGSLSEYNQEFLKKPEGFRYFKFICDNLLEKARVYLVTNILPIIKKDNISVKEIQKYRQSMKIIMGILIPSDSKSGERFRTDSNLLITMYIHSHYFGKDSLMEVLARLIVDQEEKNSEEQDLSLEDTPENRWKYLKKFFCKIIFFKIKHFLSQGFHEEIEPIETQQNNPDHPDYETQMKKNYYIYSRIHQLIYTFLEKAFFAKNKNGYIRDLLLFAGSQFSNYCKRITKIKGSIYFNYVFEDSPGKQMTEDEFYADVRQRNEELLQKVTQSMDKTIFHYLPMALRAIFEVQRPADEKLMAKFTEKIKDRFYQISRKINQIYQSFTNCNLDFGFSIPKKKPSIGSGSLLRKISEQIDEELDEEPELDLKEYVLKLNNLFAFVVEFIKFFKDNQYYEQGHPKITVNYIKSMVEFATFLLSNFEVEKHFPQQGDELVSATIRMIDEFSAYKQAKDQFIKQKRATRQKDRHAQKKKIYRNKKLKKRNKELDSDSRSNYTNQLEDFSASQNIPEKSSKKQKYRTKGDSKIKKVLRKEKSAKREKPCDSTPKPKEKKPTAKQQANMQELQPKGSILNRVVTDFIKISLTASHQRPYLFARTVQLIINFLERFSKDVVLRLESDINNIKSGKKYKKYKNKFFVFGAEIFGDLIKVKIKNEKFEGFFYSITYLGMKLMTEPHVKVDFECAIKRFFYEKEQKAETMSFSGTTKNKHRIPISDFQDYLVEEKLRDLPDISYLLTIIQEKKKPNEQKKEKKPLREKKEENYTEEYHDFTKKNYKKFSNLDDANSIYVKLKSFNELDVISLPSIKRKKPSHGQDEQKKVRFYEYHPEGDFAALICQIINHIVKIVVKEIVDTLDGVKRQNEESKEVLNVFNLKILLYSLQVLSRQSPTIVPWIARFKCKKILVNEIKAHGLNQQSEAYRKIISYVYGARELAVQSFTEVSFLTLLIKLIYPVSQISTLLFELCLDNNVLLQDKSQKPKQTKEKEPNQQVQPQVKKWITFGSLIRQKIVSEIQGELNVNKTFDENYIRCGFDESSGSSLIMKKVSCMGLLTILLSIREFAKLCIEKDLMRRLQDEYMRTSAIVRVQCNKNLEAQVPLTSNTMRNFLINYFLRPMEILQELSIQYQIAKKQSQYRFTQQFTNNNRVHIRFLLSSDTINEQLFQNDIFFKSKFKSEWLNINNLEVDEAVEYDDEMEDRIEDEEGSENGMDEMFDDQESSEEDQGIPLDEDIEEQGLGQLSMSGEDLLEDQEQMDEEDEEDNHWYGSQQDPFDRESNTFENFILYPDEDHVLENGDELEEEDGEESVDVSEDDMEDMNDDDLIDSYDDSEDEENGLDIEMSPNDANLLFPIDENEGQGHTYWHFDHEDDMRIVTPQIVPQVGIYHYFIPQEPEARDHPNHVCNNASKPEIKQLQNLYEIFMDVVSFENIMITSNMVKLENQQAKVIRILFKAAAYKKVKGQKSFHNEDNLKLEEEHYDQIFKVFSLDKMFFVSEKIDFRDCDKTAYFLQSLPIHYIDMYMDESEVYFNEITKPLRGRRRGMFFSPQMEGIRRSINQRSTMSRIRHIQNLRRSGQLYNALPSLSSSEDQNINEEENPEEPEGIDGEGEQNGAINRIEFNIQNPNGGDVNFHTDLSQILANIGMSEREFMNLPSDVQSDIIQNSLQSQLQNVEGPLNQLIGRFGGDRNGGHQAPNVSPVMQPHQQHAIEEEQSEIQMPESFDMVEENQQNEEPQESMEEEQQNQREDTPINQINNDNEITEHEALPERYRKISHEHLQKISKDIIEILNKDHKNDSKFSQISEDLLQEIIESIFVLESKDFSRFPYSFLGLNMINSKSCSKIISSLVALLQLSPASSELDSMIEDRSYVKPSIQAPKKSTDLIPKLSLTISLYGNSEEYIKDVYPKIAIKILHILEHLTKNYSISMQMLKINNSPVKTLEQYVITGSREETFLSSFETFIRLLHTQKIRESPVMVGQILRITNNIVSHYFEKNIFLIHQQQKDLNEPKKNVTQIAQNTENKIEAENQGSFNILPVSLQLKEEVVPSVEIHKAIELSDFSIELLCSLLMSDELRESQSLSELIMKLSMNGKNLILFFKNIETILEKLCEKSSIFLNKEKKKIDDDGKQRQIQNQEPKNNDLMKVFRLLEIFNLMIKEFKQFTYRHHIDRYEFIMGKFRSIIESKSLYLLCETISSIVSTTVQENELTGSISEIFEIFFVVLSINIELESKNGEEDKNILEEKNANKIASLGDINEKHKSTSEKNNHNKSPSSDVFLIQNAAFNKLWNEKICSPNGRLLLNSTIKKKLSTILKKKKELRSMSFFDIPMIKIILNSPHLLDFENKRALFRAEMKRLKRRKSADRVIYMSLDRKDVFQQSFDIIMSKKPEELKNRVKIDFEGEEGEDAGGLTKEWYQLLSTEMFMPNYGLFKPSSTGNTYQPSSMSYVNSEHLNYFKFIGRIMGKALFDGHMLDAYFTPAFYKHILKIPITYLDMEEEDFEYFNSLKWILDNSPIEDYMELDFTYEFDNFGEIKTKELIPNGQKVKVTEENKWRYVQLICYAKMATAVQSQLQMFLEGLHEIVPHKYLKIFDPKELEMMISGLPTIDIADLKRNTELANYQKTDQIIIWLFEVLESFDMSLRTAFLQFVTGTSKVPPEGFKGLNGYNGPQKFTIQKEFDVKKLPRAHTCFNQLDLPPYETKEILIEKLTYAITEGKEGFGIA